MTLTVESPRETFNGNDAATAFAYSFKAYDSADLTVLTVAADGTETVLVEDSDYSVALDGDFQGGTVTYPLSGSPLATGAQLVVVRDLDLEQQVDLQQQQAFLSEVIERLGDRFVMMIQRLAEDALQKTSSGTKYDLQSRRMINLPAPVDASDAVRKAYVDSVVAAVRSVVSQTGDVTATQIAAALDTELGSPDWRTGGSGVGFNVKSYGATGDGTTDDTTAVQDAEAAAFAAGGFVYFPAGGTYLVSGHQTFRVSVSGFGAILKNASTTSAGDIKNAMVTMASLSDVFVEGLTVDANLHAAGFSATDCSRVIYRGCRAINCHNGGFEAYTCADVLYHGCTAEDVRYRRDDGTNAVNGTGADGFYAGGTTDARYIQCLAENVRRIGFVSERVGTTVSKRPAYAQCVARNTNNSDDSPTEFNAGFWVENTEDPTIAECVAYDIAGNAGQTAGRVAGIVLNGSGGDSTKTAPVQMLVNTRIGDSTGLLPRGVVVDGAANRDRVVLRDVVIERYQQGIEHSGRPRSLEIDGLALVSGEYTASTHGGIVCDINSSYIHPMAFRRVSEVGATHTDADAATINLVASNYTDLTVEDCHGITMAARNGGNGQRAFLSDSDLVHKSATHALVAASQETIASCTIESTGGVFAFASVRSPSGYRTRVTGSHIKGYDGVEWGGTSGTLTLTGCTFEDCAISWTPNTSGALNLAGCDWANATSANSPIKTNFDEATSVDHVVIVGCSFDVPNATYVLEAWPGAAGPDQFSAAGNVWTTSGGLFSDVPISDEDGSVIVPLDGAVVAAAATAVSGGGVVRVRAGTWAVEASVTHPELSVASACVVALSNLDKVTLDLRGVTITQATTDMNYGAVVLYNCTDCTVLGGAMDGAYDSGLGTNTNALVEFAGACAGCAALGGVVDGGYALALVNNWNGTVANLTGIRIEGHARNTHSGIRYQQAGPGQVFDLTYQSVGAPLVLRSVTGVSGRLSGTGSASYGVAMLSDSTGGVTDIDLELNMHDAFQPLRFIHLAAGSAGEIARVRVRGFADATKASGAAGEMLALANTGTVFRDIDLSGLVLQHAAATDTFDITPDVAGTIRNIDLPTLRKTGDGGNGLQLDNTAGATIERLRATNAEWTYRSGTPAAVALINSVNGAVTGVALSNLILLSDYSGGATAALKNVTDLDLRAVRMTVAPDLAGSTEVRQDYAYPVVSKTASYSLASADRGTFIEFSAASALTLTVPTGALSKGEWVSLRQTGAGTLTVAAGTGVTIDPPDGDTFSLSGQYAPATLLCVGADIYALFGALAKA